MNFQEIVDLIDNNLADGSNIMPAEHRAVEMALLQYIEDQRKYLPKIVGFISGFDVAGSTGSLNVGGDIQSATATKSSNDSFITINFKTEMPSTNYYVEIFLESKGNINYDNDTFGYVFKVVSKSQIQMAIKESNGVQQSLKFHIKAYSLD